MTIDINQTSGLVESSTPGYSPCGCGSRRYYTKAEIDEMLKDVLDPDEIEEILDQMFTEYIESGDLEQLILNVLGDVYTKEQINALLANKLDTTAFTQSMAAETARTENAYLKDITLTINGTTVHNGDTVVVEGGTGGTIDLSSYAKTTAVTEAINTAIATETGRTEDVYAKKSEIPSLDGYALTTAVTADIQTAMASETARTEDAYAKKTDLAGKVDTTAFTECCEEVKTYIEYLQYIVGDLQEQIDELKPGPTPEPTGDTLTLTAVYNVTSVSDPTIIVENGGKSVIKSFTYNGVKHTVTNNSNIPVEFIFPSTGEQTVYLELSSTIIGTYAFYKTPLKRITIPNGVTRISGQAFVSTQLTGITVPNSVTYIGQEAFAFNTKQPAVYEINIGSGWTTSGLHINPVNGTQTITVTATTPPTNTAGGQTIRSVLGGRNVTIKVPAGSVDAYKSAWSNVADSIQAI